MHNIIHNLKFLLEVKGISQKEFVSTIDVSDKIVSNWMVGVSRMPIDKIITTCDYFNVSMDDFVRGEISERTQTNEPDKLALK